MPVQGEILESFVANTVSIIYVNDIQKEKRMEDYGYLFLFPMPLVYTGMICTCFLSESL